MAEKEYYEVVVQYPATKKRPMRWGKSRRFTCPIRAQRYAVKRAKSLNLGPADNLYNYPMVYLTDPEGFTEQYDPGNYQ